MLEGQEGIEWEQWLALATAAEAAGLDGLFRSDHYRSIMRGDPAGSLDAWTTLAALAARTERFRLGTMVSPVTFRPASVLAKPVATVDHDLGRPCRARDRRRLVRSRARDVRLPVPDLARTARRARPAARRDHAPVDRGGRRLAEARCSSHARRSSSADARSRARCAPQCASPTSTTPSSRRVEEARERRRILDDAAAEAGREPLRFSMMIGCVVGRDQGEVDAAARRAIAS